jgi:hypothetical protein
MATMDPTTLPPPDGLPASLPDGLPGSLLGTPPDGLLTALHLGALHPVEQVQSATGLPSNVRTIVGDENEIEQDQTWT